MYVNYEKSFFNPWLYVDANLLVMARVKTYMAEQLHIIFQFGMNKSAAVLYFQF